MSSFLSEAAATLEYENNYQEFTHNKTVEEFGEEFVKKDDQAVTSHAVIDANTTTTSSAAEFVQAAISSSIDTVSSSASFKMTSDGSLPPLTYTTTTTIPTIANQPAEQDGSNVLYCNLDDLSRYIPDNFSFDTMMQDNIGNDENVSVQVLSLPTTSRNNQIPTSSVQIQLRPSNGISSVPSSSIQTLSIPQVIDTTKLAGQLSVVQELPEVSKLVFQEVKQEPDSIVNILENMKTEEPATSSSTMAQALDYTVTTSDSPLNLVNPVSRGVKRVTAPVQHIPLDTKRPRNVFVVQGQNGQSLLQEVSSLEPSYTDQRMSPIEQSMDGLQMNNMVTMDPPSPVTDIKKEPKSKSSSPKTNASLNKSLNGAAMPSSKTCNWVFENGQVCGKTFSKSYNLVVHMRMHEDIRPFACTLCDQTFRQKAHLQRHETTHGIQSKNLYRQPAAAAGKKKKKRGGQTLSKGLQNRLAKINQNLNKANGEDSAGEDFDEEEEELYVPNGNKRVVGSDNEHSNGFDNEMQTTDTLKFNNNINKGDLNMNIITSGHDDDEQSTVQDILHTVNSVPTLEQSLGLPHITKLVESTTGLPSDLVTTPTSTLPGTYSLFQSSPTAQSNSSNILFTTLSAPSSLSSSHKSLSFIDASVPAAASGQRQVVIDTQLDDHSPEIQAEILNALLADQSGYVEHQQDVQELWEEEIYRLTTLPSSWWVSRKRRSGSAMDEVSYYSPEGYCFKNRSEIQDYLSHNTLPKDLRTEELRSPPLPIDQIPIIEENYVHRSAPQHMDTNSIAQALIANLKPEPLESLREALVNSESSSKLRGDSLSLPPSPSTCSSNVMTLSTVS